MAYKKFPAMAHGSFKNAIRALQERFEPESRRDLYLAEFQGEDRELAGVWRGSEGVGG